MGEFSWHSMMMVHAFTDLESVTIDIVIGGRVAATFLGSEGRRSLQDLSSSETIRTGSFGRAIG